MITKPILPDGRAMRILASGERTTFRQKEVFQLAKLLQPTERIMSVREHDRSIQSGAYSSLPVSSWRCREYAFYRKDPGAELGSEIEWKENGVTYRNLVPDIPVDVNGKTISLQKAKGMGVYSSIRLLDIRQEDAGLFVVFAERLDMVVGKVRVVNFSGNDLDFAFTDAIGLPLANGITHSDDPDTRIGSMTRNYGKSTGWHGSIARGVFSGYGQRKVYADIPWSAAFGVAVVNR